MQDKVNLSGQKIEAFQLAEVISSDMQGTKYLAKHDNGITYTVRHVAYPSAQQLKDVKSFFKKDQILVDNFFARRIETIRKDMGQIKTATLECAHLERIKTYIIARHPDGYPFNVYVCNQQYETLKNHIREKGLLTAEAIRLAKSVLNGLCALHDAGVLHGNINSESILCGQQNSFVLGNYSVIRPEPENLSCLTEDGTNAYMPPETLSGPLYDAQSEVYAIGMVIYMLFNNNLFPFGNAGQTVKEQLNGIAVPLPARATEALGRVLIKALANREHRYKNAREFAEALENIQNTMDTNALSVPLFSGDAEGQMAVQTLTDSDVISLETPVSNPLAGKAVASESNALSTAAISIGIFAILCVVGFCIWWFAAGSAASQKEPEKRVSIVLSENEITVRAGTEFIIPLSEIPEADRVHLSCESSNPSVATVTSEGQITAIAAGETVISILQDHELVLASITVTVTY